MYHGKISYQNILCTATTLLLAGLLLTGCESAPQNQLPETPTAQATQEGTEQTTHETTKEEEMTTEEITVIPEDANHYKNGVSLFNKSIMFCANEFRGEFQSIHFENHGLVLDEGATEGYFISEEVDLGGSFKNMLASWNASSEGGTVEVSVSIKLDDGSYTAWYSW
ncbi:MAG: hypothetical protein E7594_09775, partial [Ruminococcaceae bacterium]|nr:hypothetical protein [Oscillospiraceae bacterium]